MKKRYCQYIILLISSGIIFLYVNSCETGVFNPLSIVEFDTTSHDFTSDVIVLGEYGSWIKGVSIISPEEFWTVGHFYNQDTFYNAIHWDFGNYNYLKIPTFVDIGETVISELRATCTLSKTNIWMTSMVGSYTRYDGEKWTGSYIKERRGGLNNIWARTPENIYFAGGNGSVTHFDGSSFSLMDFPSELDIEDIDGNHEIVFAVGYNNQGESAAFVLKNSTWIQFLHSTSYYGDLSKNDYGRMTAVGVFADTAYIASKTGLIKYNYLNGHKKLVHARDAIMLNQDFIDIDVVNWNDILLTGYEGDIIHYNGHTWKKIYKSEDDFGSKAIFFLSGKRKNNFFVAGGSSSNYEAIILQLKRN